MGITAGKIEINDVELALVLRFLKGDRPARLVEPGRDQEDVNILLRSILQRIAAATRKKLPAIIKFDEIMADAESWIDAIRVLQGLKGAA